MACSFVRPTDVYTVLQGELGYLKKLLAGLIVFDTNDNPISDEAILQNAKVTRFCRSAVDVGVHGFVRLLVSLVELIPLLNLIGLSNAVTLAFGERRRYPFYVLRLQSRDRRRRLEHRTRYSR